MFKPGLIIVFIIFISFALFGGCGEKKDGKTDGSKMDSVASSLIKKDSLTGKDKVMLRYVVKPGEKFNYRINVKTSRTAKGTATKDQEQKEENEMNYFYSKEVKDIDASGYVTFTTTVDSINITSSFGTEKRVYNSNVNDSNLHSRDFFEYTALIKSPFYMRVSPTGEITDMFGLEKIYDNIFKELGDTLSEQEKSRIKDSFGKDAITEIMQQEYQIFPGTEVITDSSWVKSFTTMAIVFEVLNNAKYTFKGLENKDGKVLANIEAMLNVEFKNKEAKEGGIKATLEDSETSGSGKIQVNLSRGCVQHKETSTLLKMNMKLSAQGQSEISHQGITTSIVVSLLN